VRNSPEDGTIDRSGLKVARKVRRDRVRKIAHGRGQLLQHRVRVREARADQHQTRDPPWLRNRHRTRDKRAERMADQRGPIDFERIKKSHNIPGEIRYRVARFRTIRVSIAALIDG
jgi:hypothetical protein